jgi:hypothetical protein
MPIALNVGFSVFFLLSLIFGDLSDDTETKMQNYL